VRESRAIANGRWHERGSGDNDIGASKGEIMRRPDWNLATRTTMRAGPVLVTLALLAGARDAEAQDCGAWPRPVVCQAELVAVGQDGRGSRLGERARLRLAPRERVELRLDARDQRGRRFPADRLALQFDARQCRGLVGVEPVDGGLRLTANAGAERCRLAVWMPGNLNFEWEVDLEVDPRARTSYSRRQSEFVVDALYQGLLNRAPDAPSVRAATAEVQLGNLDGLVDSMVRSPEFRGSANGVSPEALLDRFYAGLLGRTADTSGVRAHIPLMRARRYGEVVMSLLQSPEFERRLPN
jgi:hypothetical protein